MNFKKTISFVLIVALSLTFFSFNCFAYGEIYNVDVNSDGAISIFYSYPSFRGSEASVVIENSETGDIIWFNQFRLNDAGILKKGEIYLPQSGEYTIIVFPQYSQQSVSKNIIYYSESDILNLWNIVATSTSKNEISSNWNDIQKALKIEVSNLDYVNNTEAFYEKTATQRTTDLSVKNEENMSLLVSYLEKMALLTAFEQNESTIVLKELFKKLEYPLASDGQALLAEWKQIEKVGDYSLLLEIFADLDKTIMSDANLFSYMTSSIAEYKPKLLLKKLNNAVHTSQVNSVISDVNNSYLLGISDLLSSYLSLNNTSKVDEAVRAKGFQTIPEFRIAFSTALTSAINAQNELPYQNPTPPKPSSQSSGSVIGGGGGGSVSSGVSAPTQTTANAFCDLNGYSWAESQINELYKLGIISGKSENNFAPGEYITREEIIKLVVCLFNLKSNGTSVKYNDVEKNSWYESYVNIASQHGITNGIGNNMFGTGLNASRQDIAVILKSALEKCSHKLQSADSLSFSDVSSISSYALLSVSSLYHEGIITGDTNGNFNPQSPATRAEVAVMISRIYNKFVKESR